MLYLNVAVVMLVHEIFQEMIQVPCGKFPERIFRWPTINRLKSNPFQTPFLPV